MRAQVIYESIFGNTRDVAEAIAAGLRDRPDVDAVSVSEVGSAPAQLDDVDLLVIGGPVHAWSMSRPGTREGARLEAEQLHQEPVSRGEGIRDWLERLPATTREIQAASFDTAIKSAWSLSGSAAKPAAKRLRARGLTMIADPTHFFVAGKHGPMLEGELERARAWAAQLPLTAQGAK
ncbi:flavodoxin [Pseudenhygromyxa sp. WMMC2535]|uniref:flavodoxin family protein n=1 Tax=Pseudenhygromyxa sp. WMMC2535 TaxID=2712867 RepID=UPI001557BA79|nr:flavodoxin domain-containing protein [Pseudenhygromyxa sp. WMMC2535]NVB40290.1 flavodoxin [Pseudenhygromyxa sp. WMMC2535]